MVAKMCVLLLAVFSFLGAQTQSRPNVAPEAPASETPTISLCSLFSKPADYDGKKVKVRALYNIGFEWAYFDDPSCKEYAVKSTPFWTGNVVCAEFDESVKSSTQPKVYDKFRGVRSFCCPDDWQTKQTEIVFTGKFFRAKADGRGYGHLGRYALKLVVDKVEEVGETKVFRP
jgi:hypothetical protein